MTRCDWSPPNGTLPSKILRDAESDSSCGRYPDALRKFRWYFDNAVELEPSQYGVRLSFALHSWHDLACAYEPAMDELLRARGEAAERVRANDDPFHAFHDLRSINRVLNDDGATYALFLDLHRHQPDTATAVYRLAQSQLVANGKYDICLQYLQPDAALDTILRAYSLTTDPDGPEDLREQQYRKRALDRFRRNSATLIALLAHGGQNEKAKQFAWQLLDKCEDPQLRDQIESALQGRFPTGCDEGA